MSTKRILFITFVTAAVLCCFAYSCTKQNDYDTYVETTTERFSTVDEQVAYLEGLLVTLGAEKSLLENYADSLATAGDARAEVVDSLLDDLGKKMQAVDDSLAKYATKEWADATFATLDAVKTLSGTAAALAMKVKADSTAIAANITNSITASETELTAMFEDYYKSDTVGIMINALKTRLDTFPDKVKAVKDSVALLRQPVSDLQTKYAALSDKLDSAVSALKKQDTVFMKRIDSLDKAYSRKLDTLSGEVAANKAKLDELTGRIAKLEARVQSVEVVPDYIDGSVKMMNRNTNIKFEVRPASAAKALVAKGVSAFSLQAMQVKAVTKASVYTNLTVSKAALDADSLLVLTVDGTQMPAPFFDTTEFYSARLSINDGNTGKSTPYFPLTPYIVLYPEAPGEDCIEINGTIWAPVNCGYDAAYKYGKLYQWGRKDGCGYNDGGTYTETILQVTKVAAYTNHINSLLDATTFNDWFYTYGSITDWYADDASYQLKSWPMKSGDAGYVADKVANPCPSGWRVPTVAELEALRGSHTGGNLQNGTGVHSGMKGKWFDGSTTPEPESGVFLPAAGYRSNAGGGSVLRGSGSHYWSSAVNGIKAKKLWFGGSGSGVSDDERTYGYSVRCVME